MKKKYFQMKCQSKKQHNLIYLYTKMKKKLFASMAMKSFNQKIRFQSVNDTIGENISK